MSPKLKPLILPQLVERRRKLEMRQQHHQPSHVASASLSEVDLSSVYYTANSSSSDINSPLTPTFSGRGHLRYSSSTSSLELQPPPSSSTECPSSPTQTIHSKSGKRLLPDVKEEPREEDKYTPADPMGLYRCLCDEACSHRGDTGCSQFPSAYDIDYDIGFLSDGDMAGLDEYGKNRSAIESPFAGLVNRFGSRFPTLSRWKSAKGSGLVISSSSEFVYEPPRTLSRPPSSRSSSTSAGPHQSLERANDPILPTSPDLSFWESKEDIVITPAAFDSTAANAASSGKSLERDRSLATTPLLPPLFTRPASPPPQQSPLESPTITAAPPPSNAVPTTLPRKAPTLQKMSSVSSFRPSPASPDLSIPFPNILHDDDEWADKLGHANFTIVPQPYRPETYCLDTLKEFRADWDIARVNYTKHIVRTGENYGETSKIYALTEAKWAEIEKSWRATHDDIMATVFARQDFPLGTAHSASRSRSRGRGRDRANSGSSIFQGRPETDHQLANMEWRRIEDTMPTAIPRMLDAEGKFPSRGDEDIVGPMARDAVMVRTRSEERKGPRFWKHLVGRVGLRKRTYTATSPLKRHDSDLYSYST